MHARAPNKLIRSVKYQHTLGAENVTSIKNERADRVSEERFQEKQNVTDEAKILLEYLRIEH